MLFDALLLLVALLRLTLAQQCRNITIPVSVNATNVLLSNTTAALPQNQTLVTAFVERYLQQPQPQAQYFINGTYQNIARYNITATFCTPSNASSVNTSKPLILAIHGIGFSKDYWFSSYNSTNNNRTSFANYALAAGYPVLAIDRLGCGNSSFPDGRNQVQTATHIEVVRSVVQAASNGSLVGQTRSYNRTVLVGHSYGSIISNGFVNRYPSLVSGIVLTGFSANATWVPQTFAGFNPKIAAQNQPSRFNTSTRRLPSSYLVWSDIYNNQLDFFHYPYFQQDVLQLAESRKQPVTMGELVTLGQGTVQTNFTGPVAVNTGNRDFIFCGGNCSATGVSNVSTVLDSASLLFPRSRNFSVLLQPDAGHALQLHTDARNSTQAILSFLAGNGL
ncbi:hypothetical protein PYCC9005_004412 [Savitreella phatthalungensis]